MPCRRKRWCNNDHLYRTTVCMYLRRVRVHTCIYTYMYSVTMYVQVSVMYSMYTHMYSMYTHGNCFNLYIICTYRTVLTQYIHYCFFPYPTIDDNTPSVTIVDLKSVSFLKLESPQPPSNSCSSLLDLIAGTHLRPSSSPPSELWCVLRILLLLVKESVRLWSKLPSVVEIFSPILRHLNRCVNVCWTLMLQCTGNID